MTKSNGSLSLVLRRIVLAAGALALVAATVPAEAGQRRARLSRDLRDRLSAPGRGFDRHHRDRSDEQLQILATRYGARIKKRLRNAAVLEVTGGQLAQLEPGRRRVERLGRSSRCARWRRLTAEAIGADQVWAGAVEGMRGFTGRGIGVAIIDSGIDARHPHLRGRVVLGLDFTGDRSASPPAT